MTHALDFSLERIKIFIGLVDPLGQLEMLLAECISQFIVLLGQVLKLCVELGDLRFQVLLGGLDRCKQLINLLPRIHLTDCGLSLLQALPELIRLNQQQLLVNPLLSLQDSVHIFDGFLQLSPLFE